MVDMLSKDPSKVKLSLSHDFMRNWGAVSASDHCDVLSHSPQPFHTGKYDLEALDTWQNQ